MGRGENCAPTKNVNEIYRALKVFIDDLFELAEIYLVQANENGLRVS